MSTTTKRGTWPYMAPEMLLEGAAGEDPLGASRATDVYALGVLCWEVLTGQQPWAGATEQRMFNALLRAQARGEALPQGVPLTTPPLPLDLPAGVRALLEQCLGAVRGARPRVAAVAEALQQAAQAMASGEFDVFLSHAWTEAGRHAPLTTEVNRRLTDAGLRVWLDVAEMGADPRESMRAGIRGSRCVVALLSERYGTRPSCLRELEWAQEMGKPVVGCLAEAREGWFLGEALRALLPPETHLFPDLRAAAGVDWGAGEALAAGQRELLTKAPTALPQVLRFVQQLAGAGGSPAPPEDFVMPTKNGQPDFGPVIEGPLAAWRAANPGALVANVSWRRNLTDADFVHFRGLLALNMSGCTNTAIADAITDAAFAHLRGINTLYMSGCNQASITDAAFAHLRGIHTLNMRLCNQDGITDTAFEHLRGIHTLDMSFCSQASITDAAFVHLRGIHTLDMSFCSQASITDAAFVHLRGIHTLDLSGCSQEGITDAAFAHLRGIHSLHMSSCSQAGITDAAFVHLCGIHTLVMNNCCQAGITDAAFAHLRGIHTLDMNGCRQPGITDAAFVHLRGIQYLAMLGCDSGGITAAAFTHLSGIQIIYMNGCPASHCVAARALGLPVDDVTTFG